MSRSYKRTPIRTFAHLHVHTTYSLFDGLSSITELFEKAESLGQPGLAITDHGFLYGVPEFMKVAEKHPSVKPVIGCEIYLTDHYDHHIKDPDHKKYYHLILLAKNLTGYRNLLKICSEAAVYGQYRGKPRVSHDYLSSHSEGLIAMPACIGGDITQRILDNNMQGAEEALRWYKRVFGDDFYLEVSQHESRKPGYGTELLEMQQAVNESIFTLGEKFGIMVVATNDVHFVNAEDASAHDTLIFTSTGKPLSDKNRLSYSGDEYLKSEEQMLEIFKDHPEVVSNTMEVLDKIERYSIWSRPQLPQYPIPERYKDADDALKGKVYWYLEDHGWKGNKEYEDRIEKELSMIRERHCADYFLIVSDLCDEVWERGGVVGPGRGASASLLVNYQIGITEVNPMDFGLKPERFFSYNRDILPDIDIDFDERGREIAGEYLTEKYGTDHVAHLGTYEEYSAQAAVDDAVKIEGGIRSISIHSCGWLLSRKPLTEYVPLTLHTDRNTGHETVISQYDSHFAEDCGSVKMDFLSLSYLNATALSEPEDLNDRETMELFAKADTVGVFQFESEGMRELLGNIRPERFEHLVALYSMYRPEAMDRIGLYASLKNGFCKSLDNPFTNLHEYTDETFGMIIYQEQLMGIVSDVASFSLEDMRRLRKFAGPYRIQQTIEGQQVYVLEHLGKKFVGGGLANGYDKKTLEQFWNGFVRTYDASYLFNKSHAVCYTLIAYRLAYLKAHEPTLFYNILYTSLKWDDDRKALFDDALKHGLVYMEKTGKFYTVIDD